MIEDRVLLESCEDYVGLWSIIWCLREIEKESDPTKIRLQAIKIIGELLEAGLVQCGTFSENGNFEIWQLDASTIISRIEKEWDALGREPNMGEIVWFVATQKGQKVGAVLRCGSSKPQDKQE